MKSITDKSHTLAEALLRMRDKTLAAEARGDKTVSIGSEDLLNLKDAAFRCDDFARMANTHNEGFMDGVQRQRITGLEVCSKWSAERGHDDFAKFLADLAKDWEAREQTRSAK